MYPSSYELKSFYNSDRGRVIRHVLQDAVQKLWPDKKDKKILGYGYATPYLRPYLNPSNCCIGIMPGARGAVPWPPELGNHVAIAHGNAIPLESETIDNILVFHALEFGDLDEETLTELWRVLKSNGRIIVAVPNRMSIWARTPWSPLGIGTPYTLSQLYDHLQQSLFVHERTVKALYTPPFRMALRPAPARFFEHYGPYILPLMGGMNIVEFSKQIYAGAKGHRVGEPSHRRRILLPATSNTSHNN